MQIALMDVPGRFPTVSHDAGRWWDVLSAQTGIALSCVSLNYAWWRQVCAPASQALDLLECDETYASASAYAAAVHGVEAQLAGRSEASDFELFLGIGPVASGVNYLHAPSLVQSARQDSALRRSIAAALTHLPTIDLAFLRIRSEYELLTAMCVAMVLKRRTPATHVCLLDHGYENYSLQPHLEALERAGGIGDVFDSVIASKDEIDTVAIALALRIASGTAVRGVLRTRDFEPVTLASASSLVAPVFRTFAPATVMHVRASERSCYWGRCVFCTQNTKFEDPRAPSKADVQRTVDRLDMLTRTGVRHVLFADEAISPVMLRALSTELLARGVVASWACRCKLERTFDQELLDLASRAGCREILFGLETISPDLLRKMDKYVTGQTADDVAALLARLARAGIGVHLNLISGFPGETLPEAVRTVEFVERTLRSHPNATFLLNPFALFPQTPMAAEPSAYGIRESWCDGDMPVRYGFRFDARTRRATHDVVAHTEAFGRVLEERLGWSTLLARPGGRAAFLLYTSSGHSAIFKCRTVNPLDAERHPTTAGPAIRFHRRPRAFVTGATGNVGGAAVAELLREGWDVVTLIREPGQALPGCEAIVADLQELPDLSDALAGMDALLHCGSPRSLDRHEMLVGEIEASARLLDAWSTGSFLYMSSQTVYGTPTRVLREDAPLHPSNWYDLTKITVERQVDMAAASLGGPGLSLRLPLVFHGEGQRRDTQFLGSLWRALKSGARLLFSHADAPDEFGSVYIGGNDLGRAMRLAALSGVSGPFNLSGGFVSWRELVTVLSTVTGVEATYVYRSDGIPRTGEFRLPHSRTEYDCSRFRSATGFAPRESLTAVVTTALRGHR